MSVLQTLTYEESGIVKEIREHSEVFVLSPNLVMCDAGMIRVDAGTILSSEIVEVYVECKDQMPGVSVVYLSKVIIPEESRGTGLGTKALNEIFEAHPDKIIITHAGSIEEDADLLPRHKLLDILDGLQVFYGKNNFKDVEEFFDSNMTITMVYLNEQGKTLCEKLEPRRRVPKPVALPETPFTIGEMVVAHSIVTHWAHCANICGREVERFRKRVPFVEWVYANVEELMGNEISKSIWELDTYLYKYGCRSFVRLPVDMSAMPDYLNDMDVLTAVAHLGNAAVIEKTYEVATGIAVLKNMQ